MLISESLQKCLVIKIKDKRFSKNDNEMDKLN